MKGTVVDMSAVLRNVRIAWTKFVRSKDWMAVALAVIAAIVVKFGVITRVPW